MAGAIDTGSLRRVMGMRDFRLYWIGNGFSILGFWIYRLAVGWLTWQLTQSFFWSGLIGFTSLFPASILTPFSGAIGDRYGLKRVAIAALIVSTLGSLVLTVAAFADTVTIELILAVTILQSVALAFDLPARQALLVYIVGRADISTGIAVNTTTFHAGAFLGPALFGLLIAVADIAWAFAFNTATFLFFALALWKIQSSEPKRDQAADTGILTDIWDGIRYAATHRGIQSLLMLAIISHLLARSYIDMLPGFAADVFERGADGFTILAGASGLGSLVGGVWLALRGRTQGLTFANIASVGAAMALFLIFAATKVFAVAVIAMFGMGFALISFAVASQSLLQNVVDNEMRGRVIGLSTGMAVGLPGVGALLLGGLGAHFGIQSTVVAAMVIGGILWLGIFRRLFRQAADLES